MADIKLGMNDALRIAATDKRFASAFLKEPEAFAAGFGLDKGQLDSIKEIQKRLPIDPFDPSLAAADFQYE